MVVTEAAAMEVEVVVSRYRGSTSQTTYDANSAITGNNGGGGGGGGGGAPAAVAAGGDPTSWEGMYDDVPQPNFNQGGRGGFRGNRGGGHHSPGPADPNHAPPANAPTGPKNAGRPGANYRGGGRGNNRGYHPYQR